MSDIAYCSAVDWQVPFCSKIINSILLHIIVMFFYKITLFHSRHWQFTIQTMARHVFSFSGQTIEVKTGDLLLSGCIIWKGRFFYERAEKHMHKTGWFNHSKERFSQVMTRQVIAPTPFRSSHMILLKACFNIEILAMDFKISETNKGEKSLISKSYVFCIDYVLKSSDISCPCTNRSCKERLTDSAIFL